MKMLKRQDVLFTRMPEIRSGEFYDQTASKAAENLLPIKESGPLLIPLDTVVTAAKTLPILQLLNIQIRKIKENESLYQCQ